MFAEIQKIDSFENLLKILLEDSVDHSIGRIRSPYIFRGMNNKSYKLIPSFRRNCGNQFELEQCILRNFTKYAIMEHPELNESIWRQMIVGQHHGLPTRLIDWTYSPLAALHFATDDINYFELDKNDAVIWKVNINEINKLLPKEYNNILKKHNANILTVDMLGEVAKTIEEYNQHMGNCSVVFMEPPSIDARIINQFAAFSIVPNQIEDLDDFFMKKTIKTKKIIISKEIKWEIRDKLDQMNMSERVIYPGLGGVATFLKRHYFTKKPKKN